MCSLHYSRVAKYGDPMATGRWLKEHADHCAVAGCNRPYNRLGFCRAHADRLLAHGSATLADEVIAEQDGLCAICRRPARGRGHEARLHLDHDHRTGALRGALCGHCNKGIGHFYDDPELLRAAATYLVEHQSTAEVA